MRAADVSRETRERERVEDIAPPVGADPQEEQEGAREAFLRQRLERAARSLGKELRADATPRLLAYLEELNRWNKAYNLVGRRSTWEELVEHAIDSLAILMVVGELEGRRSVDVGTGAGLPGIPLYLAAGPFELALVESTRKKIAFLQHSKRMLEMERIEVVGARAEEAGKEIGRKGSYDLVMMRAVADSGKAMALARLFLREGGSLVLLVGKKAADELSRRQTALERAGYRLEKSRSAQRLTGRDTAVVVLRRVIS
jgi:16S rRNA (guanine527-N7)-methyltransferase